jgi:hypothetical protein
MIDIELAIRAIRIDHRARGSAKNETILCRNRAKRLILFARECRIVRQHAGRCSKREELAA